MRIKLICIATLLTSNFLTAQNVAINNDGSLPTIGAMLDVKSTNKGILIPRIPLTGTDDVVTVPNRPASLLIYNTASSTGPNAVAPGFYYWDGISWVRLTNNTSSLFSGWMLGGNNGTSPSTHFIGTTDNNSLQIKVNNQPAGYIGKEANDGNVFLGYQSGKINTGYSSVGIGIKALFNNIAVNNLVAVGDSALFNNISGPFNTAVGSKSLYSNTSGNNNTATGFNSLYSNTIGYSNTAIGYYALKENTYGSQNTAIGETALSHNTTGNGNVAIGAQALSLNSIGTFNTAVGGQALSFNTGSYNSATGFGALMQNTTGEYNTANGALTLFFNTTGKYNSAYGFATLEKNLTGFANSAMGYEALVQNTTGNENTATGFNALSANNGSNNTAMGSGALFQSTVGSSNTATGYLTLRYNNSGNLNTAIGYYALQSNISGNSNTALGQTADVFTGDLSNATAIGANARVDCSSCLVLGSVNGINSATSNVNIGMGETNPRFPLSFGQQIGDKVSLWSNSTNSYGFGIQSSLLQIHTDISAADIALGYGSSGAFTENMRIKGNGNVGIGISSPVARLHIMNGTSGGTAPSSNLLVESNGTNYVSMLAPDASANGIWFSKPSALLGGGIFYNDPNVPDGFIFRANNIPRMTIKNNGNVGIGLNNPLSKFHILNGSSGYIGSPFPDLVVESSTNTYLNFLTPNANESGILFGQASNAANGGIVYNNSANPNGFQFRVGGNNTAVIIDNNQRLGIRMSPPSPLSVGQLFGGTDMIGLYSLSLFGGYTDNWHIGIGSASALYFSSQNGQVAHVDATTGNWISISDQRLKKNIQPLLLVLPRLMQLNAVSYQMNSQTDDEKTFGFLAQEMQKIFPEAVKTFDSGDKQKLGIAYTQLIPLVVTAIQEQQKTIQQLQLEIDELKKLIKK